MTKLFFGYGSTLDPASWPGGQVPMRPVAPARLPDNVLAFDYRSVRRQCGVLNLRKRLGGVVEGYLFAVDDVNLAMLDGREGHPGFYAREEVVVLDRAGNEVRAVTYRVVPSRVRAFTTPSTEYLTSCMAGRARFDLSTEDVQAATENRESVRDSVFVYGTLMRGERRASSWKDLPIHCVLMSRVLGTLHDHGEYPGFVPGNDGLFEGEFMRFDRVNDALAMFDAIEGFVGFGSPLNLFRRTLVEVDVGGGRGRTAWTYVTTQLDAPRISAGDWRRARGTHRAAM